MQRPMRRSLSEVPKGLRPIRTSSGRPGLVALEDEGQQAKGFVARLKWARQQALRQTGKQHATQPTPARVSQLACLHCLLASSTLSVGSWECPLELYCNCVLLFLKVF